MMCNLGVLGSGTLAFVLDRSGKEDLRDWLVDRRSPGNSEDGIEGIAFGTPVSGRSYSSKFPVCDTRPPTVRLFGVAH